MTYPKFVITCVSTLFALAGLASCSALREEFKPLATKDCTHPGLCEVDVTVNGCSPTTNDKILVNKSGGAVEIRWKAPAGYVFTEIGIKFDASPVIDPRPGMQDHGARWMVVDRPNGEKITSKYRIQVKSTSTGTICTGPDPVIVND